MTTRVKLVAVSVVLVLAIGVATAALVRSRSTTQVTISLPTTTTVQIEPTAVWPTAESSFRYSSPVEAARGFALSFLHMHDPLVGTFRQGDARSGEVPVRWSPRGPETIVLVRQLGTPTSWWVLGSVNAQLVITAPLTQSLVQSPLALRGRSTAYEGVVNVLVRQDNVATPLRDTTVLGGSMGIMGPFATVLTFPSPTSAYGSLELYTRSAKDGTVTSASVIRLRFH